MNSLAMLEPDWTAPRNTPRRSAWSERAVARTGDDRPAAAGDRLDSMYCAAFDAWLRHLEDRHAFGTFDTWDEEVRNSLEVGHTLRFPAQTILTPLVK